MATYLMLRTLGASAALAVIVPLPVVAATTAAADGPNIPSAALTLTATVGLGHESLTYLVLASGPPPAASTTLVDAAGESPVQVKASMTAGTACVAGPAHLTGLGNDPWCLHLIGVDAGHSVSGQLKGTRSVVTLTVKARQAIWLPALTGALILLLAVLAAWLAGTFLPPRVSRVLLHLEVCKDGGVTGLKEWADKADGRISTADVLARVRWAKRVGRGQVLASRASLKAALETKRSVIPECPLRDAGQAETTRGDQVAVDDLLTPGGAATVSTAEHLLQTVETATSGLTNFIAISKELINRISASADKDAAQKLADQTVANAKGYLSEFTLGKYLDSLQQALEDIGRRSTASETVAPGTAGLAAVSLSPSRLAASALSAVRSASVAAVSTARPMIAIVPFALLTLALMIIAVAGVLAVQYFPNPTFGSGADYLALAATAFGAAQAAAVLALLLLLRGPADWYG